MDVLKSFPEIGAKLGALLESWMAADAANEAPRSSRKLQVGMNRLPIMEPEK
jgi:hypothetical protein